MNLIGESSKTYKEVRLVKSCIGEFCTVGDYSELIDTKLNDYVVINRRNYITSTSIGMGTYTGHNVTIKNAKIGKFCSLSWNISIGGKNHDYEATSTYPAYHWRRIFESEKDNKDNLIFEDTVIQNDVWIGAGAIILRGVKIGNGAIVGAGAVVTKDVEPYSIVAGVPAKAIGKRFNEITIQKLQELAWWDWSLNDIEGNLKLIRGKITNESLKDMCNIKER